MNLKDAFRAQNKLQALMDEASCILQDRGYTLKVTTTHLRSKVMPEAQDAVTEDAAPGRGGNTGRVSASGNAKTNWDKNKGKRHCTLETICST